MPLLQQDAQPTYVEPGNCTPESRAATPVPMDISAAVAKLEQVHARYSAEFEKASRQLAAIEQRYRAAITSHYRKFDQAKRNRELIAVGRRRVVRLHETVIRTANAAFVLSRDVAVEVESGGGIARLTVRAPTWRFAESFEIGIDIETFDELTKFAELVQVGTRKAPDMRQVIAARTQRARAELRSVIEAREEIDRTCERLVATAEAPADLDETVRVVTAAIERAPRRDRGAVRKARKSLATVRGTTERAERIAAASVARVNRHAVEAARLSERLAR